MKNLSTINFCFFAQHNALVMGRGILLYCLLWVACMLPAQGQGISTPVNFAQSKALTDIQIYPIQTELADVDGDGHKDIVTLPALSRNLIWYKNNGDGTFNNNPNHIPLSGTCPFGNSPLSYNVGGGDLVTVTPLLIGFLSSDLNNDGLVDLVVYQIGYYGSIGAINVLINMGNGLFNESPALQTSIAPKLADIDGDGFVDIVYVSFNKIKWRINGGNGSFGNEQQHDGTLPVGTPTIQLADINQDGNIDILLWAANSMYLLSNLGGVCNKKVEDKCVKE